MRKFILTVVIVVVAASAGAYLYLNRQAPRQTVVESVLPGDTLVVVRLCELSKQIERFRSGRMGKALSGIDWPNLLIAMGVSASERPILLGSIENIRAAAGSMWFNVLFGKDFSMAVLNTDFDPEKLRAGQVKPLLDAVVMVSRPTQPTRILESLGSMLGSQLSVETEAYGQWKINRLPLENGQPLYYALADGLMIAGFSSAPVKSCLDQSRNQRTSLLSSETYRHHCAALYQEGKTDLVAYADVEGIVAGFRKAIGENAAADPDLKLVNMQLENLQGIESVNLAEYDDGGPIASSKMIVGLNRKKMSPYLTRSLAKAPGKNPTLKYVPVNALLYGWQNTFDLKLYWENMQQDPRLTPASLSQFKQMFAEKTGVDLETLIAAFGSQAGVLINDINMDGMFPIPELAVFAEVSRPEVIDGVIRRRVGQTGMQIEDESYAGTDIHYVSLPLGAGLNPAYTFSNSFCTVAVNRALLKNMLSAPDAGNLEIHPHFKAFGDSMTSENNSVFYLRSEGLIAKTRQLVSWGMSWMAMAKPDKAENMQKVVSLGVMPLLDGLSMFQAVGGRAYVEEDRVCSDVQVLMDRT